MAVILLLMIVCGLIGDSLAARRGEGLRGFVLGALLGPLGILFVLARRPDVRVEGPDLVELERGCRFCAGHGTAVPV